MTTLDTQLTRSLDWARAHLGLGPCCDTCGMPLSPEEAPYVDVCSTCCPGCAACFDPLDPDESEICRRCEGLADSIFDVLQTYGSCDAEKLGRIVHSDTSVVERLLRRFEDFGMVRPCAPRWEVAP